MRVIDLALKDLKQLIQDRRSLFFLLVMPLAFTLLFGFMFGGFGGGEEDPRLLLALVDEDGSPVARQLVAFLGDSEVFRLVEDDGADIDRLKEQVAEEDLGGALVIPEEYGEALMEGELPELTLIVVPDSLSGQSVQQDVAVIANRLYSAVLTARLSVEAYERVAAFPDAQARQAYFEAAFEGAVSAWEAPPIETRVTKTGQVVESEEDGLEYDNAFIHSSPGMMMQFAIAGLMGAADIIIEERKTRSLQRLLTTAISRPEILLGHYLAMFVMIFAQIMVLIVFGQLFLQLDYLQAPGATLLIAVSVAACIAALGLLIGALAKSHESVVTFSLIPMFVLSGIGGAWVPLEFTSDTVQKVGHLSPVAWGMDGFKNILARGQGLDAAWLPAGTLLLFAVGFFVLAVWRFRFQE